MSDSRLMALSNTARILFTEDFLAGRVQPDFGDHVVESGLGRTVDLTPVDALINKVLGDPTYEKPEDSDGWLAPRLHAALRLRRTEAANRRIWMWLAVMRYSDYVRWRFPGTKGVTAGKRFLGGDRDNAISRLWWGAELTRNGSDYGPSVGAFARQDIPSTWFVLNAFHNRAAALAAMRMLPTMGGRPINRLANAFNHYLTTIMLDSVAPLPAPDLAAMEEWVSGQTETEELLSDTLPAGPLEDPVDPTTIDAVEQLVRRVAGEVGIPLDSSG